MRTQYCGESLLFSYIAEKDLFFISEMLGKESVCRWMFFGPNLPEVTKNYFGPLISGIKGDLENSRLPKSPVFTIREKITGFFAGQCAVLPVDFSEGAYLIGYQLDDICWRRGFGTEACRFLIYYTFCVAEGYRINGDCVPENTGSWKIMERCGFKKEGVQRRYWHHKGSYYDRVLYGLLRDDLSSSEIESLKAEFEKKIL